MLASLARPIPIFGERRWNVLKAVTKRCLFVQCTTSTLILTGGTARTLNANRLNVSITCPHGPWPIPAFQKTNVPLPRAGHVRLTVAALWHCPRPHRGAGRMQTRLLLGHFKLFMVVTCPGNSDQCLLDSQTIDVFDSAARRSTTVSITAPGTGFHPRPRSYDVRHSPRTYVLPWQDPQLVSGHYG